MSFISLYQATAYASATGCLLGATCFLVATCAECVPSVHKGFEPGDGLQSKYDWLVLFCSMVGSKFFGIGCVSLYILANNPNYPEKLSVWEFMSQQGPKPRFLWFGFHNSSWAWWGAVIFCLGSIQYNIASTSTFAHNFPQQYASWSARKVKWLCTVMYTSGGAAYCVAGACYVVQDTGPWFWKGILCPSRRQDSARLAWWINWWYFWGGLLYCIGGVFGNYNESRIPYHPAFQIENTISFGGGSICYIVGALLSYVQRKSAHMQQLYEGPSLQQRLILEPHLLDYAIIVMQSRPRTGPTELH